MRCSLPSFLAATAGLLLALPAVVVAVETLPEMRHEQTPSWPGSIAPVDAVDIGAYTGRWFQVRAPIYIYIYARVCVGGGEYREGEMQDDCGRMSSSRRRRTGRLEDFTTFAGRPAARTHFSSFV